MNTISRMMCAFSAVMCSGASFDLYSNGSPYWSAAFMLLAVAFINVHGYYCIMGERENVKL